MQTIAFVGGGTAGHVMPNLALISNLKNKYNCVYIGGDGMEKSLCASRGIPFYQIKTVKLRRDKKLQNLAVPFKLCSCVSSAKAVLKDVRPALVFSKGGYAALPVVLAAKHIPVVSHESDFSPGLATKIAKRKSRLVLTAFEDCAAHFKNGKHTGTPLNPALYSGKPNRARYGFSDAKPVLAVIGGSSGAAALNACTADALSKLLKLFDIVHVTGKGKSGAQKQNGYCPVEFENDMPTLYATADIIVSRAGAGALAETVALAIPTLAVPLEKASRGDQLQNAAYYESRGAIKVLKESDMTADTLVNGIAELYNSKEKYKSAMRKLNVDGTDVICGVIEEQLSK